MNTKPYAFFDFDGTLISKDSFILILKKIIKNQPYRLLIILIWLPIFILTGLLRLDKTLAKSLLLWSLTVGKQKRDCAKFLRNILKVESNEIWFQEVIPTFEKLNKEGVEIIIVTASGQAWVRGMLQGKYQNIKLVIGSQLTFFAGGVVLKSKNCYQEEKLKRIQQMLGDNIEWHSAWSDHIADLPMLSKAKKRNIICPKEKHLSVFKKELNNDFDLLQWSTK